MQVKITIPNEIYNQIKNHAKEDMRTVNQEINYLLKLITNSYRPGSLPTPAPIITPMPGIPEYPYQVTATTTTAGLAQTIDMNSLPEGMTIKYTKPTSSNQHALSQEEEELHQAKLQQQMSRIKQQRIKFLKQKAEEILGYSLPYLRDNDQKTIDWVLNQYPTDEDIITYLQNLKFEDENYIEENEQDDPTEPQNEYYQKIKRHYAQHLEPHDFEDLISNAKAAHIEYLKDYHQLNIFDALDIPHSHSWTDEEWSDMIELLLK